MHRVFLQSMVVGDHKVESVGSCITQHSTTTSQQLSERACQLVTLTAVPSNIEDNSRVHGAKRARLFLHRGDVTEHCNPALASHSQKPAADCNSSLRSPSFGAELLWNRV